MRFEIVQGDEQLSSHSGLALAGAILHRSRIRKRLDAVALTEHQFPEISHGEVATAMIGLICLGKPDFDAIEAFRDDPFFPSIPESGFSTIQSDPQATAGQRQRCLQRYYPGGVCRGGRTACPGDHSLPRQSGGSGHRRQPA